MPGRSVRQEVLGLCAESARARLTPASAAGAEQEDVVTNALARLRPGDREAITLVAWDGLTPAQAAAALGLPGVAFRVRLHRAKARLHRELQHDPRLHPAMTPVPGLDEAE